jgi:hypothetical protein
MNGLATRLLPYGLAFFSSLCIMILELVASRLVARHVGSSLVVWNSVIGIMLGGICLGNVLGGRLADRVEPGRAVGLCTRWGRPDAGLPLDERVGGMIPDVTPSPGLRTMLRRHDRLPRPGHRARDDRPVVAKMAVEQAAEAGSAIGDVYTLGRGRVDRRHVPGRVRPPVLLRSRWSSRSSPRALALISACSWAAPWRSARGRGRRRASPGGGPRCPGGIPSLVVDGVPINALMLAGHGVTLVLGIVG